MKTETILEINYTNGVLKKVKFIQEFKTQKLHLKKGKRNCTILKIVNCNKYQFINYNIQ